MPPAFFVTSRTALQSREKPRGPGASSLDPEIRNLTPVCNGLTPYKNMATALNEHPTPKHGYQILAQPTPLQQ